MNMFMMGGGVSWHFVNTKPVAVAVTVCSWGGGGVVNVF